MGSAVAIGADAAWGLGDLAETDRLIAEAIASFRSAADTLGLGYASFDASLGASDLNEAPRLAEEADELLRGTGSAKGIANSVEARGDHRLRPRRAR